MSAVSPRPGDLAGRRFAFLSHYDYNLYRFRLPIMQRLVALGARVYAVAPQSTDQDLFAAHGIEFVPLEMRGDGLNPIADAFVATRLRSVIDRLRPHLLQTFMLKPNLVGGLMARRSPRMRVVSTVTGLGRLYEEGAGIGGRVLRWGADQFMRRAFAQVSAVVFQNADDRNELVGRGLCPPDRARLISSSGVDLSQFDPAAVDPERVADLRARWRIGPGEQVVTMVARLLPSKGVREFAAASRALRGRARFVLIGPIESTGGRGGAGVVPDAEVGQWQREGVLIAPGLQDNIEEWLAASDIYTLPSYYREGVPRSVLEALAMGLPVVTTHMPGCRETVVHGENGFLVPPRDGGVLADALGRLLDDAALRQRMGAASRSLAAQRFSSDAVADQHLDLYREVLERGTGAESAGG